MAYGLTVVTGVAVDVEELIVFEFDALFDAGDDEGVEFFAAELDEVVVFEEEELVVLIKITQMVIPNQLLNPREMFDTRIAMPTRTTRKEIKRWI